MNLADKNTFFMNLALNEAQKGLGMVNPNPLVGAVLVRDEKIIGVGHHEKYGSFHAEVNAINDAKKRNEKIEGSILYVNLEPCSHTNKQTPPCAPLIVKEKISKVVIANLDPNPFVNGAGVKLLQENNIEVITGIMEAEGKKLNEVFFHAMKYKRPFVHLKMAQTLDGKIATKNGESKYITGIESREYVHQLRHACDAVVIGKNTLLKDDPSLTVRFEKTNARQPLRVVFIDLKSIDFNLKLFSDEFKRHTMVVTTDEDASHNKNILKSLEEKSIATLVLKSDEHGHVDLNSFLNTMYSLKLNSILVEGGATLASAFLSKSLVDKITVITAPVLLGEGISTLSDIGIKNLNDKLKLNGSHYKLLGSDFLIEGYLCSQA